MRRLLVALALAAVLIASVAMQDSRFVIDAARETALPIDGMSLSKTFVVRGLPTNGEVIAANRSSKTNRVYFVQDGTRIGSAEAIGSEVFLASFDTGYRVHDVGLPLAMPGLSGSVTVRR